MGRLLFPGKDAPTPAWDGPASVCDLIGDDGRIYTAELESVRALNPGMDFPGAPGWEDTPTGPEETAVIVDEMGSELYEALDADPGQVTLASPFLSYAVAKELATRAADSEYYWYLLTRLDAHAAAGGYLSIAGLGLLLDAGVEIRNCTGLHAKAFVVGRRFAMVGSGNLTNAGLGFAQPSNRELAVRLPRSEVRRVQRILDEWWDEGSDVGADKLTALQKQVDSLPRPPRGSHTPGELSNQDLAAVVEQILGDARDTDAGLWIKAVDGTPEPRDWDPDGWFSSHSGNRPGFAPGDLVLLYSKEQGGCVGVLEVLDEPAHDPEFVSEQIGVESGQRWPWVNTARPRLMPLADVVVSGDEMGVKRHGLQGGRMHIGLTEFAGVVRALAAGCEAASPGDRVSFLG
ncbi:phospholipase D-like domain-containing protein [Dietzia cinnamea]|nr:phospholipase D-like domain-containing protein [Dietzia cinnamea]